MASQTLGQVEDGSLHFALPGGLILAEEASVAEHMASHSRAVEQAAAQVTSSTPSVDRRTGVPEDVLKALPVMSFADALVKECEKPDEDSGETGLDDTLLKALDCCKGKKIPGLQVDSDAEERLCEICQSGYNEEDEVCIHCSALCHSHESCF
jgi:hypothetical protein